jgi:hypothetical protein
MFAYYTYFTRYDSHVDLHYNAWLVVKFSESVVRQVPRELILGSARLEGLGSSGYSSTGQRKQPDIFSPSSATKRCSQKH